MKKILTLVALSLSMAMVARADVTVNLGAGNLLTKDGAALPADSLLLLISAGADHTFSSATLGLNGLAFGDDVILGADVVNNNLGGLEATSNLFDITNGVTGQSLAILWFPGYTLADYNASTALPVGSYYGFFAGAATGEPNGGDAWILPGDGGFINLLLITQGLNSGLSLDVADAYPDATGYAVSQSVPEPGVNLMFGIGLVGLLAFSLRRTTRHVEFRT